MTQKKDHEIICCVIQSNILLYIFIENDKISIISVKNRYLHKRSVKIIMRIRVIKEKTIQQNISFVITIINNTLRTSRYFDHVDKTPSRNKVHKYITLKKCESGISITV